MTLSLAAAALTSQMAAKVTTPFLLLILALRSLSLWTKMVMDKLFTHQLRM